MLICYGNSEGCNFLIYLWYTNTAFLMACCFWGNTVCFCYVCGSGSSVITSWVSLSRELVETVYEDFMLSVLCGDSGLNFSWQNPEP